jgi:hypothetical protein
MVNCDLLENKTEMMLNGDIMFRLQKKVATVLSPPPELAGKLATSPKLDIDPIKGLIRVEDPAQPVSTYEATQAALIA